jgi:hypothetical protein
MKVNVFKDAECWIKISAKALGHIGNPADLRAPECFVGHISPEDYNLSFLNNPHACDEPKQCRLTGAVRADHSDHSASRDVQGNIVERKRFPVAMGNALDLGYEIINHWHATPECLPATKRGQSGRTPNRGFHS